MAGLDSGDASLTAREKLRERGDWQRHLPTAAAHASRRPGKRGAQVRRGG